MDKKTIIDFAGKLNSKIRDVFVLNEIENKSVEDISKDLSIELSETRKRLKQAKTWFKRVLPEARLKKKIKERPEGVYIVLRGDYEWERYNYNPNISDEEIISDAEHFFNNYSKKELHHSVLDIVFDDPEWSVIFEDPNDTAKTARANGKFTFDVYQQFVGYETTMTKDGLLNDFKQEFIRSQSYFVDDGFYFEFNDEDIQMDPIIDDQGYIIGDNQKLMEAKLKKALSKTKNFKKGDIVMVNPEYYKDIHPVIVDDVIKQSIDKKGKPYGIIDKCIKPIDTTPVSYDVRFFLSSNDEFTFNISSFMLLPREHVNINPIIDNSGSMNEARLKRPMKDMVDIPLSNEYKNDTISRATLRPEDLAYAFKRFIEYHIGNYSSDHRKDFEKLSQKVVNLEAKSNTGTLIEDDIEEYNYVVDELIDMLNMIAPDGTYFGSHPGDYSDFGFWEHEDDDDWGDEFVHEPEDLIDAKENGKLIREARLKKQFSTEYRRINEIVGIPSGQIFNVNELEFNLLWDQAIINWEEDDSQYEFHDYNEPVIKFLIEKGFLPPSDENGEIFFPISPQTYSEYQDDNEELNEARLKKPIKKNDKYYYITTMGVTWLRWDIDNGYWELDENLFEDWCFKKTNLYVEVGGQDNDTEMLNCYINFGNQSENLSHEEIHDKAQLLFDILFELKDNAGDDIIIDKFYGHGYAGDDIDNPIYELDLQFNYPVEIVHFYSNINEARLKKSFKINHTNIELSTVLLPIIDVCMYNTLLDPNEFFLSQLNELSKEGANIVWDYFDNKKYVNDLFEIAKNYIEEYITPEVKSIGIMDIIPIKIVSPTYYNYGCDNLYFDVRVDLNRIINDIKNMSEEQIEKVNEFCYEHFRSVSGFISFMPKNYDDMLLRLESNKDIERGVSAYFCFKLDDYFEDWMGTWFEYVNDNLSYYTEYLSDDMPDEIYEKMRAEIEGEDVNWDGEELNEARLKKRIIQTPRNVLTGDKAKNVFKYILDYNAEHGTYPEDKIGYVGYYKDGNWWVAWDNTGDEPFEEIFDTEEKAKMWVVGEFDIFNLCPECGGVGCQACKNTGYQLNQQPSNNFQPKFDVLREVRLKKQLKSVLDMNDQEIVIGDDVEVESPNVFDLWNNTFVGTVVSISYDDNYVTVRDQEDMYYEMPAIQVQII